jgi:hypothetical protein
MIEFLIRYVGRGILETQLLIATREEAHIVWETKNERNDHPSSNAIFCFLESHPN